MIEIGAAEWNWLGTFEAVFSLFGGAPAVQAVY